MNGIFTNAEFAVLLFNILTALNCKVLSVFSPAEWHVRKLDGQAGVSVV